jgi:DNA-binding transcriptional LysR family regulator
MVQCPLDPVDDSSTGHGSAADVEPLEALAIGRILLHHTSVAIGPKRTCRGALVEVLAGFPTSPLPVRALYSHTRQLSPRLRVFIEWMAEQFRLTD